MKTIFSVVLPTVALVALAATLPLQAATVRIVQTNSAGDSVMLIDPDTNKIVGEIPGIEVNHGAAAAPDGSRLYITNEAESTLDVADLKTLKVIKNVPLTNHPNNVAVSKDGKRVTEGLQGAPAHGRAVTSDGKTLGVLSKMNTRIYFYPLPDLKLLGESKVGHHPDWLTFTPDGKRVYVANAGSNSVSVVDVTTRKELMQIPVGQVPKRNITAVLP